MKPRLINVGKTLQIRSDCITRIRKFEEKGVLTLHVSSETPLDFNVICGRDANQFLYELNKSQMVRIEE